MQLNSSRLARIWHHPYTFWALLAIPAIPMIANIFTGSLRGALHESGEFSARLMIIAMMITPLIMLFPRVRALRWLRARRRYVGVAAFGYASIHTIAYVMKEQTFDRILGELPETAIWTGWLAVLIFVPLAMTSHNWFVRALGHNWKTLQRLIYVAAFATVAHWYFLEYEIGPALAHFMPLVLLELYRIGRNMRLIPASSWA